MYARWPKAYALLLFIFLVALAVAECGTSEYITVPLLAGCQVFTLWLSVQCVCSKAWLAARVLLRLASLALQAVLSAHGAFAPRARSCAGPSRAC